jgi:hypothetical protein
VHEEVARPFWGRGGGELTSARLPTVACVVRRGLPVRGLRGSGDDGLGGCRRCRRSGGAHGRVDGAGERLELATTGDTFVAVLERRRYDGGPSTRWLENGHGPTDQGGGVGDSGKLGARRLSPVAATARRRAEAVMEREQRHASGQRQ